MSGMNSSASSGLSFAASREVCHLAHREAIVMIM